MRGPSPWRARMVVAVSALAVAGVLAVPGPATAASAEEARLLSLSSGVRASAGAPALATDESLAAVARRWAATMAAAGTISHNPDIGTQLTGWSRIAENVGMGPDLDTVHRALVASPTHYANLTDTEVTLIGVGVVTAGGTVFVVENFMRPAAPAPKAVAPATAAPAPRATVPPRAPVTTMVVIAPPPDVAQEEAVPPPEPITPSPWLTLVIEMTRSWERTTGRAGPRG